MNRLVSIAGLILGLDVVLRSQPIRAIAYICNSYFDFTLEWLQALSNGIYKSVWHRAVVNAEKPRLSVASFLCPYDEALISPAKPLTEDGTGAVYRGFTYAEYYKTFWSRDLVKEHCLELFKNNLRCDWHEPK